ncbi:MAG: hypothetical protein AAF685_11460 [Cyanobacteria bacterium P01_C01_bin.89]
MVDLHNRRLEVSRESRDGVCQRSRSPMADTSEESPQEPFPLPNFSKSYF